MKYLLVALLLTCSALAQKPYCTELAVTFPLNNSAIKNFIAEHGVETIPLTSGIGNGVEFGRHYFINDQSTVGAIVGANLFIGSQPVLAQIYQLQLLVSGRLYLSDSWRGGLYSEVASGAELSLAKFSNINAIYQANITTRIGLGYHYQFNSDVTVGIAAFTTPSLSTILDNSKIAIEMLF